MRRACRTHSSDPRITTLGNRRDVLAVDIFGEPKKVKAAGFYNVTVDANGDYVPFPRECTASSRPAARWQGNVRVVVNCAADGDGASWMRRAQRALAHLDPKRIWPGHFRTAHDGCAEADG
jgi:hypothetical protein